MDIKNFRIDTDALNCKVMKLTDRVTAPDKEGNGGGEPVWECLAYTSKYEQALVFLYDYMCKEKSKKTLKSAEDVELLLEEFRKCKQEIINEFR